MPTVTFATGRLGDGGRPARPGCAVGPLALTGAAARPAVARGAAPRRARPTPRQRMLPVADFSLHAPRSLEEAAATLARYEGEARPIAGGTALVLMIRQGLIAPPAVVRLDRVPNLAAIAVEDGWLRLGALATLH